MGLVWVCSAEKKGGNGVWGAKLGQSSVEVWVWIGLERGVFSRGGERKPSYSTDQNRGGRGIAGGGGEKKKQSPEMFQDHKGGSEGGKGFKNPLTEGGMDRVERNGSVPWGVLGKKNQGTKGKPRARALGYSWGQEK